MMRNSSPPAGDVFEADLVLNPMSALAQDVVAHAVTVDVV
jgi:hypothetical protein